MKLHIGLQRQCIPISEYIPCGPSQIQIFIILGDTYYVPGTAQHTLYVLIHLLFTITQFTNEGIEAQRGEDICAKTHGW